MAACLVGFGAALAPEAPAQTGAVPKVEELISFTKDGDPRTRLEAARALGRHGRSSLDAAGALVALLADGDPAVRMSAAAAISGVGQATPAVIDALIAALKDSDPDVRSRAASTLGDFGKKAAKASSSLVIALKDPDRDVRREAAFAIGMTGADPAAAIPALVGLLADPSGPVREYSAESLAGFGAAARVAEEPLRRLLREDAFHDVRAAAARALHACAGPDSTAVGDFVAASTDPCSSVRTYAVMALGAVGTKAGAGAQAAVIVALGDEDRSVRYYAVSALGRIGADPAAAIRGLLKAQDDPDEWVRCNAIAAVGTFGSAAKDQAKHLQGFLGSERALVRGAAARALAGIGVDVPESIRILADLTEHGDESARLQVVTWLGEIGPKASAALPVLKKAASGDIDPDDALCRAAAEAIRRIAAPASAGGRK